MFTSAGIAMSMGGRIGLERRRLLPVRSCRRRSATPRMSPGRFTSGNRAARGARRGAVQNARTWPPPAIILAKSCRNMWRLIVPPPAFFSCAKRRRRATNAGQMRRMRQDIPQNSPSDRAEKAARRRLPEVPGREPHAAVAHCPLIVTYVARSVCALTSRRRRSELRRS